MIETHYCLEHILVRFSVETDMYIMLDLRLLLLLDMAKPMPIIYLVSSLYFIVILVRNY